MNIELYNALLELVKQGGTLALWGITIWLFLSILKVSVVCLALYLTVRVITQTILGCYKINKEQHAVRVQLLSEEVSKKLISSITSLQESTLALFRSNETQLNELKKSSQEKSK